MSHENPVSPAVVFDNVSFAFDDHVVLTADDAWEIMVRRPIHRGPVHRECWALDIANQVPGRFLQF